MWHDCSGIVFCVVINNAVSHVNALSLVFKLYIGMKVQVWANQ